MKRIIIGLTPQGDASKDCYKMSPSYVEAIAALGAIPLTLPSVTDDDALLLDALSLCDGIILTGGPDVRPSLFGEEISPACGAISDERDAFELKLYKMALDADKPILGICRGAQVMNIGSGGNIYQDIYCDAHTRLVHHTLDGVKAYHSVTLTDASLAERFGFSETSFTVNSYHHQSVKALGKGYEALAYSDDGLIEAIYMPSRRFVLGVQWHPEKLFDGNENSACVLKAFVDRCRR